MKTQVINKKLKLKKNIIANLNYQQMKNIIGASEKTGVRATDGTGDSLINPTTIITSILCTTDNPESQTGN